MAYLFIDTETTGFKKKGDLIQEGQARVCQLAMLLTDESGKSLSEFSALIRPDGWSIGKGAQKVHGLSDDLCLRYGVNYKAAVSFFVRMAQVSDTIVAHNAVFDKGMMDIEVEHANQDVDDRPDLPDWFCTMRSNTGIEGGTNLKNCLQRFCNRSLGDKAHDAMEDAKACRDIFFAMKKQNV